MKRSAGIHDGTFHADEVTACALLLLFDQIDEDKIYRTRDQDVLESCEFVCDVGGVYDKKQKRFDHHQSEYHGDLSSAGMILAYLRDEEIITPGLYNYLNKSLVRGIDDIDNGLVTPRVGHCTFSAAVSNFFPPHYGPSDSEVEQAFRQALSFVIDHLRRLIDRYAYIESCLTKVQAVMEKSDKVLIFDEGMPWLDAFFELGGLHHPALFVIMPTGSHWKLRGIPPTYEERMKVRMPLPDNWAGLHDDDLRRISGIDGAIFCHKGLFISIWETKEDALAALEKTLGAVT